MHHSFGTGKYDTASLEKASDYKNHWVGEGTFQYLIIQSTEDCDFD